ncbi:MAG: hypothetical protein R6X32_19240 [Chloroflexota bacterium]|jgi:hypothetical protein
MIEKSHKYILHKGLVFVAIVCLMALAAACGTTEDTADDTLLADAFAGAVNESLFIGVLVAEDPPAPDRKALIVYLCDGADFSTWLFGETTGDSAVLEGGDTSVALSLGEDSVTGEVVQAGAAPQPFVAELGTDDAGLFRGVETFDGQDYVGGWIVLNDGRQRGAITLGGQVVENPPLDLTTREAETSMGILGTNCFINPHTGERICRYLN